MYERRLMHIIYKIKNLDNNRYYIGSKYNWKGYGTYWGSSKNYQFWKDKETDNFEFEILETVEDPKLLNEREIYFLELYDVLHDNKSYNLTIPVIGFCTEPGSKRPGIGGPPKGTIPWNKGKKNIFSNETIEKFKRIRKGKIHSCKISIDKIDEIKKLFEEFEYTPKVSKNGKILPKERAFSKQYSTKYDVTPAGLHKFMRTHGIQTKQ